MSHARDQVEAVPAGHAEVGQHQVVVPVGEERQRLEKARGAVDVAAPVRQGVAEHRPDVLIVVHHQDSRRARFAHLRHTTLRFEGREINRMLGRVECGVAGSQASARRVECAGARGSDGTAAF